MIFDNNDKENITVDENMQISSDNKKVFIHAEEKKRIFFILIDCLMFSQCFFIYFVQTQQCTYEKVFSININVIFYTERKSRRKLFS